MRSGLLGRSLGAILLVATCTTGDSITAQGPTAAERIAAQSKRPTPRLADGRIDLNG